MSCTLSLSNYVLNVKNDFYTLSNIFSEWKTKPIFLYKKGKQQDRIFI